MADKKDSMSTIERLENENKLLQEINRDQQVALEALKCDNLELKGQLKCQQQLQAQLKINKVETEQPAAELIDKEITNKVKNSVFLL